MQKSDSRIAFYCSSLSWGGLEMNVVRYADWLRERGWSVMVIGVNGSRLHLESQSKNLEFHSVIRNKKHFDLINAFRLSKLLQRNNVDLVWYRDNRDLSLLSWTKWMPGAKFKVLYQQAMQFGISKKDIFHSIRFSHIDLWISTLSFLADQVKSMTHFPKERIIVIPLGTENRSEIAVSKKEARGYYNVPEDAFVFGILGRLDPLKGQDLLIKAISGIENKLQKVHVLIVGESTLHEGTAYEDSLKKLTSDLGLEHRVHFHGFTKETFRFYKAIDVFVMASKGETFGMVTIEAMSFGVPVIGTHSSGTPEILHYGSAGWLFEPDNSVDLKDVLNHVLSSKGELESKGEKALQLFRALYSKEASLDSIESALKSLS